jgi:hypothetical protein
MASSSNSVNSSQGGQKTPNTLARTSKTAKAPRTLSVSGSPEEVARLIYATNSIGETAPQSRGRTYPYAFQIKENDLSLLEDTAREWLIRQPSLDGTICFSGTVRFPDLSTQKFSDLDTLLKRAGQQKDPEALVLSWTTMLSEPFGNIAEVTISCTTGAPLESEYRGVFARYQPRIELVINGSTGEWADAAFGAIDPIIATFRIGGIYKPLCLFGNDGFLNLITLPLTLLLQLVTISELSNLLDPDSGSFVLRRILRLPTVKQQLDAFLKNYYTGSSPVGIEVFIFVASIMVLLGGFVICRHVLPLLAPRSGIEIGLAGRRMQRYRNVFHFVVFSILLLGITLPVLVSLMT